MYSNRLDFTRQPFQYDVDTDFFFPGGTRGDIVDDITASLSAGVSLVTLTGTDGSGKTMICRKVVEKFGEDHQVLFFEQGVESFDEVIEGVLSLVGEDTDDSTADRKSHFKRVIDTMREEKRRLILVIDSAELIFLATLERIRSIVDLANDGDTIIQLVLSGQPLFLLNFKQLGIVSFQDVEERSYSLDPLDAETTCAYLNHCIVIATGTHQDFFSLRMADRIMDTARGNFRLINQLADRFVNTGSLEDPEMDAFNSAHDSDEPIVSVEENGRIHASTRTDNVDLDFLKVPRLKYQWYVGAAGVIGLLLVLYLLVGGTDDPAEVVQETEKVPDLTLEKVEPDPIEIPETAEQPVPVLVAPQANQVTEEETAVAQEPPTPVIEPKEEVTLLPPVVTSRNDPEIEKPELPPVEEPEPIEVMPAEPEGQQVPPAAPIPETEGVALETTELESPIESSPGDELPGELEVADDLSEEDSTGVESVDRGGASVAVAVALEQMAAEPITEPTTESNTEPSTEPTTEPTTEPVSDEEPEHQPVSVAELDPEPELAMTTEAESLPSPVIESDGDPTVDSDSSALAVAVVEPVELDEIVREIQETGNSDIGAQTPSTGAEEDLHAGVAGEQRDLAAVADEREPAAATAPVSIPEGVEREPSEPVVTSESIQIPELTVVTRKKQRTEIAPFTVVTLKDESKRQPGVAAPAPVPKPNQAVAPPEPQRVEPIPVSPPPPVVAAPITVPAPEPTATATLTNTVAAPTQGRTVETAVVARSAPKLQDPRAYYSERLAAGSRWLVGGGSGKYTVKLTVFQSGQAERGLGVMLNESDYQPIKDQAYLLRKAGQPQTVTLYFGEFDSRDEAHRAQQELPQFLQDMNPSALAVSEAVNSARESQ